MKNYKVVVAHRPFFAPSTGFEWEPRYFRWEFVAWIFGLWMYATQPCATDVTVYRRRS